MEGNKGWVFIIGFLVILLLIGATFVWVVYTTLDRAVTPVQSLTGDLATQVSSVMNPTPTILPSPLTLIRDIRSLARLETIQFTVEKVITAESNQGVWGNLFGDKLILVARGRVIAGVDLSKVGADDLELRDGILILSMPEPEVFVTALDNKRSYVYDRDTGLLTKGDVNLESSARAAAEDEIEKAAVEDEILDMARQNSELFLTRLLNDLGYPDVIFEYPDRPQATPTPQL